MSFAIRVENLGKLYAINQGAPATTSLREQLGRSVQGLFRPEIPTVAAEPEVNDGPQQEYWALKDVSFEVNEGERLGIIGANGAGKSTLLKILSRVTAPTEGRVEIRGKVASLLEVGTGFHPDLTGRENIFLNGAILGMSRQEIRAKFDRIVHFSGVERFIDTPVKHYSSGMYVRLAFSVSAWLDPDILIVDEVLAVGDQEFQRKCAERMRELTGEGRTVLFVSHSMATVNQMCQKALYLERGRVVSYGPVAETSVAYHRDVIEKVEAGEEETATEGERLEASGDGAPTRKGRGWRWHRPAFTLPDRAIEVLSDYPGVVECLGGEAASPRGDVTEIIPLERVTHLHVRYRVNEDLPRPLVPTFNVLDEFGTMLFVALPDVTVPPKAGDYTVTCVLPPFLLNEGRFTINANLSDFLADKTIYFALVPAFRIEVKEHNAGVDPRRHGLILPIPGFLRPQLDITVAQTGNARAASPNPTAEPAYQGN